MKVLARLRAILKGKDPRSVEPQLSSAAIFPAVNRPEPDSIALQQVEKENPTIYAGINRLVNDIWTPRLVLVTDAGKGDKVKIIDDHPSLIPLQERPNDTETPLQFWHQVTADLIWLGNGFVWTDSEDGITPPQNFLRLDPARTAAEPPEKPNGKIVDFYRWRSDKTQQDYPPHQILHFRTRGDNPYRGEGVAPRLRDWINLERQAMAWQYRRFYNDIPVDLILTTSQKPTDPDTRRRMEEFLDTRLSGRKNGGRRWLMMQDGEWKVEALPRAMEKDIQYIETLKFIRTTYAMAMSLSPAKLSDYSDAFRANAEAQRSDHWEDVIMAWHALILDTLNMKYLRRWYPDAKSMRYQFDYSTVRALQKNQQQITQVAKDRVMNGMITINEARENYFDMEGSDEEGADDLRINGETFEALDREPPTPVQVSPDNSGQGDQNAPTPRKDPVPEAGETAAKGIFDDIDRPHGIDSTGDFFDHANEMLQLRETVKRDIAGMVKRAGERQLEIAGVGAAFHVTDPIVLSFVAKQTLKLAEDFTASTEELLRRAVAEAINDGLSVLQMRSKLQDAYAVRRANWQLDRVAQTEVHQAQEGGSWLAAAQAGLEMKRWITARDSRVRGLERDPRADHASMEGQEVPMGTPFTDPVSSARLQFPGDRDGAKSGADTINCRCTWIATFNQKSIEFAALDEAWDAKSADRERWERGVSRRLYSYLLSQEKRVLESFDRAVREGVRARN